MKIHKLDNKSDLISTISSLNVHAPEFVSQTKYFTNNSESKQPINRNHYGITQLFPPEKDSTTTKSAKVDQKFVSYLLQETYNQPSRLQHKNYTDIISDNT